MPAAEPMRSITDMEEGDFVLTLKGELKEIAAVWGVTPVQELVGQLTASVRKDFGVITKEGELIGMREVKRYYKRSDKE